MYFDGSFCSGSPGIDRAGEDQNRQNDEPKDVLALLAAKDNLTSSVDVVYFKYRHIFDIVENVFALDNLHLENGRKSLIILTGIGHNNLIESIIGKLDILLISLWNDGKF